ncbi:MAG: BatA domain-containing protein, partial [Acetobacteraceae bacterium]
MLFSAPWVLVGLLFLPGLWWVLRLTPPPPRRQRFPAVALLAGLTTVEDTPARTPWWLLLLRMAAAGLVVLGLAGPVWRPGAALPGKGPLLLVMDNGWASAPDWPEEQTAAAALLRRAARANRQVILLPTAADPAGRGPVASLPLAALVQEARVAALRPEAWPPTRTGDLAALARVCRAGCPGG